MFTLIFGILLGIGLTIWFFSSWAASDEGRRQTALYRAEQRIREARTQAYVAMADSVDQASPGSVAPRSWPSEEHGAVVEGVAIDVREREE